MKKFTLGLSLAAIALAGAAYAEQGGGHGDHAMTRADVQAHAAQMFDRLDANHDGKLDAADKEARRMAMFDRLDTNHDGQISRDEFMAFRPGRGGGHEGMAGREGGPDGGPGHGGWGGHHGGGMGHGRMMGMMSRMADTNHDGAVSKDEFLAAALQHFDRMDANHDGTVTPDERRAAGEAMRQHMHDRMGGEGGHDMGGHDMGGHDMPPPNDGE